MMFARPHQTEINPLLMHYDVKLFKPQVMEGIGFRGLAPDPVNCIVGRKAHALGQGCVAVERDGVIRFVKLKGRWIPGRESVEMIALPGLEPCSPESAGGRGDAEAETAMLACAGRFSDFVTVRVGER